MSDAKPDPFAGKSDAELKALAAPYHAAREDLCQYAGRLDTLGDLLRLTPAHREGDRCDDQRLLGPLEAWPGYASAPHCLRCWLLRLQAEAEHSPSRRAWIDRDVRIRLVVDHDDLDPPEDR
jgi:hypothetical protein